MDINNVSSNSTLDRSTVAGSSNFKAINVRDRLAETKTLPILAISGLLVAVSSVTFMIYEKDSKSKLNTIETVYSLGSNMKAIKFDLGSLNNTNFEKTLKSEIDRNDKIIEQLKNGSDEITPLDKWDGSEIVNIENFWTNAKSNIAKIIVSNNKISASINTLNSVNADSVTIFEANSNLYSISMDSKNENLVKPSFEVNRDTGKILQSLMVLNSNSYNEKSITNIAQINDLTNKIKKNLIILKESQNPNIIEAVKSYEDSMKNIFVLNNEDVQDIQLYAQLKADTAKAIDSIDKAIASQAKLISTLSSAEGGTNSLINDVTLLKLSQSLLALAVFGAIIISMIFYRRQKQTQTLAEALKRNQINENALVDLLEEIKPLDDGDFTRPIRADDQFLSQIAQRIDKTREQFREIASLIKYNSDNIDMSAGTTEESSQELLKITDKQVENLEKTIDSVFKITNTMDEIAQTAWIVQEEALRSAEKAENGNKLVSQSVGKMNEIRDTIQDSAKKIKKLGESAQSITEVTGLIKDITKQINILALNAAIQAASSGESGREFTIVAQEVQRLADDSEEATKKIEELIGEIQTDTAVAIASMEKTTQEVVAGAKLTEEAGISLQEINDLSRNTSEQIRGVSEKLEEESQQMANVTFDMKNLQKVSDESKEAVNTTSVQVEALRDISQELKVTVERFKV